MFFTGHMTQRMLAMVALSELDPQEQRTAKRELRRALVGYAKEDAEKEYDSEDHTYVKRCVRLLSDSIELERKGGPTVVLVATSVRNPFDEKLN